MHYCTNTVMHYYINVKVYKNMQKRVELFRNSYYNIDKEGEIKKSNKGQRFATGTARTLTTEYGSWRLNLKVSIHK